MNSQRLNYLDYAKGIGIILVILGHIFSKSELFIKNYIYSFHMPLFFLISGILYFVFEKKKYSIKNYFKKNVSLLFLPYLLWGLIFCKFTLKNLLLLLYGSQISLSKAGSLSSLWFIPCFFISNVVFILFCHQKKDLNKVIIFLIGVLGSIFLPRIEIGYPFSIDTAFSGVTFIIIGYYISKYFLKFLKNKVILMFLGILSIFSFFNSNNNYILMATRVFNNNVLFYIFAIIGSLFIISLSMNLSNKKLQILDFFGENSLLILMIHKLVIIIFETIFSKFLTRNILYFILMIICVIPIVFCLAIIINRMSFVFGGRKNWEQKANLKLK